MAKSNDTIWEMAIGLQNEREKQGSEDVERSLLLVGSKNCGKTSIILRFLDRDEAPKPTTALEYTFGRRAKGPNAAKDIGHIWELGGGVWLAKLVEIPLSFETLMSLGMIIAVDLSLPNELWTTLETLLAALKDRVDGVMAEASKVDPEFRKKVKKAAWDRLGGDHVDKDMMEPFPIPIAIVGCKYDIFQDMESEKRKIICKTLRFLAHTYGAHLLFFSAKQEPLISKVKSLISTFLFSTPLSKVMQLEHNKPLQIPAGLDSMQAIGAPPVTDGDLGKGSARTPVELWKKAYTTAFPQDAVKASGGGVASGSVNDPARDPQFAEAAIDSLRAQKDKELDAYRRQSERRLKDIEQGAA